MYTPESLYSYFRRAQLRREEEKTYRDPPRKGPSMIIEAYRHLYEECPYCKTNKFVVPLNTGKKQTEFIQKFECTQCETRY